MRHFHAPEIVPSEALARSVFLAGGITDAPIWQEDLAGALGDLDVSFLNPRRNGYSSLPALDLRVQIAWEHNHLRAASAISFWFPAPAPCLISLFELGAWSHWHGANGEIKPLFVGLHPDYMRRENIEIQLALERPEIQIASSLDELARQIRSWANYQ